MKQGAARSAAISFTGAVAQAVLGFALTVLIGRLLGPAGAGLFFTVAAVFFVLSNAVELGADTSLTWALPRLRAHNRRGEVRETLRIALRPVWAVSVLTAVGVFAAAPLLAQVLFDDESVATGTVMLRVMAPALALAAPMTVALAGTRGLGSVVPFTVVGNIGLPLLRPVFILLTAAFTTALPWIVAAWSLPVLLGCVAAFVLLARAVRGERVTAPQPEEHRPRRVIGREFWTYSRPRGISAMLEIALVWIDVILVAAIAGPAAAGIYAAASRFVTTGTLAEAALRVALSPRLSELLARGELDRTARLVGTASVWITAVSWPLYLALATFAPFVLRLFGPEFSEGGPALAILAIAMAVSLSAGNVQSVLLMSGRSAWQMANKAIALTLDVVLCFVLIPPFGMVGAACAWATAILVDTSLAVWQVRWKLGVRAGRDTDGGPAEGRLLIRMFRGGLALLPVAAAALLTYGALGLAFRLFTDSSAGDFFAYLLLASAAYAALLWFLRPLLEIDAVLAGLRRRGARS